MLFRHKKSQCGIRPTKLFSDVEVEKIYLQEVD